MEKNQYDLCLEVLRRLDRSGILNKIILIGSWCLPFYGQYFRGIKYQPAIKTRDLDFLFTKPLTNNIKADIPALLKDLGFIIGFKGSKGYIVLQHPDLIVEFLVVEKGKGSDNPVPLPGLGINATALRYLGFLTMNTIKVEVDNFTVILPHPANFALHKLIVAQRRRNPEKKEKDMDAALNVIHALIAKGEKVELQRSFNSVPHKWQDAIIKSLKKENENDMVELLQQN